MHRGLIRIICFFALVAFLAYALHAVISSGLSGTTTSGMGAFNRAMNGQVNADIVVSGSSRAYVHYDPSIIKSVTGKTAFNLGRDGSHTDVQLAVLKAYLEKNKKPELVLQNLDMHSMVLTPRNEISAPIQYVPYLHNPLIYEALLKINPSVWKWRWIPLYGYVVEDINFGWLLGVRSFVGRRIPEDHIEGYCPARRKWTGDFDRFKARHPSGVGFGAEPEGVQVLQELIDLCRTNDIKLALVYSPQYYEMIDLVTNKAKIFALYKNIAETNGVPFWDYTTADYCRDKEFFYNSQHLNKKGADRFSRDLADRLVSTQSFATVPRQALKEEAAKSN